MLILTLTMYAMSAAVWAIDVKSAWVDLSIEIPLDLAGGDADIPGSDSNTYTDLVENVLTAAISITGDAVVLWRACVVWGMRRGMWIFPVILIFVQICAWVVYTIGIVVEYSVPATPASFQPLASPSAYTALVALAFSISLAANVWATAMVAYKTWKHRSDVRRYLNDRTRKSAVEAVFLLLVESGVFYAILWIFYTLADIGEGSVTGYGALTRAEFVWSFGINQMPGIYLTIVVVVVTLQQSHLESTLSNMRSGGEHEFALRRRQGKCRHQAR
ncbi:hypothetical protein OF83DRAFT_48690 [Amylostereum chailletii]|nr:hypothetical protein OF83DRAFT_48690 [Amylostereum chailletii]